MFGATTFYNDYWKKPELSYSWDSYYGEDSLSVPYRNDTIKFENTGQSHADNLRIAITPDPNVINITIGQHTQNMTLRQEGDSWILETRKFPSLTQLCS